MSALAWAQMSALAWARPWLRCRLWRRLGRGLRCRLRRRFCRRHRSRLCRGRDDGARGGLARYEIVATPIAEDEDEQETDDPEEGDRDDSSGHHAPVATSLRRAGGRFWQSRAPRGCRGRRETGRSRLRQGLHAWFFDRNLYTTLNRNLSGWRDRNLSRLDDRLLDSSSTGRSCRRRRCRRRSLVDRNLSSFSDRSRSRLDDRLLESSSNSSRCHGGRRHGGRRHGGRRFLGGIQLVEAPPAVHPVDRVWRLTSRAGHHRRGRRFEVSARPLHPVLGRAARAGIDGCRGHILGQQGVALPAELLARIVDRPAGQAGKLATHALPESDFGNVPRSGQAERHRVRARIDGHDRALSPCRIFSAVTAVWHIGTGGLSMRVFPVDVGRIRVRRGVAHPYYSREDASA